ncbi:hypothetical protein [Sebaldella sp. S0638]|uniref:hypothetical protein n=1 Tax=Sebaldella sp. S0638 TaxID=2957809 RepID=UPI0020A051FC|nr:hypothetical protein [Sebaldella sp. S0638]MCP1226712.1 hypothetical protein [Sebaldella sp. S0638]
MEEIKEFAYEIDKNIRKKYGTEAEFCRSKNRVPQSTNKILNNLKKGEGANIISVFEILKDLNIKISLLEDVMP